VMVDVNTNVGDPGETPDGTVIVPVTGVSFGFAAGGTEFQGQDDSSSGELPSGGGSGGGISLNPAALSVGGNDQVRLLPVDNTAIYDRLVDMIPKLMEQIRGIKGGQNQDHSKQNMFEI